MNMLRTISVLLIFIMTFTAFASCSDTTSNTNSDTIRESNDTDVTDTTDLDESSESVAGEETEPKNDTEEQPERPKQSPIAYFSFNKTDANGNFIEDLSGVACRSIGTPTYYKSGKRGGCLFLDGKSYLSFSSNDLELPTGNEEHTVSAWIKINKNMPESSDGVVAGWGQYRRSNDTRLLIYRNQFCASSYGIFTAYPIPDYYKVEWMHLAMTYANNTYRMYLNGTLVGAVKGSGTDIQKSELFVGGFGTAGLNFMGALDEVCIYDKALTDEEIVENMNGNIDYKSDESLSNTVIFEGADTPMKAGWNSMMYVGKAGYVTFKMYLPKNYNPDAKYPIIMFMPGDGAIGKTVDEIIGGNESVYMNRCIIEGEDCICIVPAMPNKCLSVPNDTNTVLPYKDYSLSDATPSATFNSIRSLLSDCIDSLAVDKDRVYFIGYSRGTMAGFYWLADDPDLFAGALLCCGASDPASAAKYKDVPIWMFIGDADNLVSTERFKAVYDAYTAAGGEGKFTFFKGGTHSLKPYLVSEEGVVQWLLSQNKSK